MIVLQPSDRVVAPGVITHVQAGELPRRPGLDLTLQPQHHLPDAGGEEAFGGQHGVMLALGQPACAARVGDSRGFFQGGGDGGVPAWTEHLTGCRHPAHHGAHDAGAPGVLPGQKQSWDRRTRAQRGGPVPQWSSGRSVEGTGGVGGVVLVGERRGDLHVVHQIAQARCRAIRQLQHAAGDALLEGGVLGASVSSGVLGPLLERLRVAEGDDLGRVWGLPGLQ